jgi:hypothetical protein
MSEERHGQIEIEPGQPVAADEKYRSALANLLAGLDDLEKGYEDLRRLMRVQHDEVIVAIRAKWFT